MPQIDGLRFVAIMAVIAYHVSQSFLFHRGLLAPHTQAAGTSFWLNHIFAAGHNGVPLFFAISGFILSLPFARQALCGGPPVSLRDYYIRRVTRIEPPYVIQLVIMVALCILILKNLPSHPHLYGNPHWFLYLSSHTLSSLVYAHSQIFGTHAYPNYVLWSLEVEVQFYLVAPYLARFLFVRDRTKRWATLIGLFAASVTAAFLFGSHYRIWASLPGNLQFFLLGLMFADLYVEGQLAKAPGDYTWDIAFVLAGALVVFGDTSLTVFVLPSAIFICFMAAFRGRLSVHLLQNPWVVTIGGMCYTIYLYHLVVISTFIKVTEKVRVSNPSLDLFVQFVLLSAAIIPSCAVLFVLFERPFMNRNWPDQARQAISRALWPRSDPAINPAEELRRGRIAETAEEPKREEARTRR